MPIAQAARLSFPVVELDETQAQDVRFGRRLAIDLDSLSAVFGPDGEFLALYGAHDLRRGQGRRGLRLIATVSQASRLDSLCAMTPPVIGVVDSPQDQELLGPQLQVRGWAMCAGEVIVRIEAFLDGESLGLDPAPERPDVFDAHPEAGPFSGFEQTLQYTISIWRPTETGQFEVRVTTADGSTQVLVARQLVVPKAQSRSPTRQPMRPSRARARHMC